MKTLFRTVVGLVLASLCLSVLPAEGAEKSPRKIIQQAIDDSLVLLRDEELRESENIPRLRKKLTRRLKPLFDFREMTLRALGRHGGAFNPEQVNRLTDVFGQLLERVYTDRLTEHLQNPSASTRVEAIRVTGEQQQGKYSRIESVVLLRKNAESSRVGLNYKMVKREGEWNIYDLEIEGVSLIGNYRSQFNEILTNGDPEDLIQKMTEKLEELRSSKQQ